MTVEFGWDVLAISIPLWIIAIELTNTKLVKLLLEVRDDETNWNNR